MLNSKMFPSSNNYTSSSLSYPCFPSSPHHPPFTFLNPENPSSTNTTTTFLHDPLSVITYIPSHHNFHAPQIPEPNWILADNAAATVFNQDLNNGVFYGNFSKKGGVKKTAKKDRHSKIHTSQGLRDRRVRLSIEIARKFFDLQDMLGFDKASNTLEWLLTKSKKAIRELTQSNKQSTSSNGSLISSSSDGEVVSMTHRQQQQQEMEEGVYCVKEKMKESREKARARARERASTSKSVLMYCDMSAQGLNKKCPETQIVNPQLRSHSPLLPQGAVSGEEGSTRGDDLFKVFEESIVIKRKLKHSLTSSIHQNVAIPKELPSVNNGDYHSFPNFSPNWEPNTAGERSNNICSLTRMNLSTGLQIFGKTWEDCTNQHP